MSSSVQKCSVRSAMFYLYSAHEHTSLGSCQPVGIWVCSPHLCLSRYWNMRAECYSFTWLLFVDYGIVFIS
uniref:Uncharacterized protein n=1 Tax=Anguilla anguilla TaxID=7936 RepID=A0A0E9VGS0_ANGAN